MPSALPRSAAQHLEMVVRAAHTAGQHNHFGPMAQLLSKPPHTERSSTQRSAASEGTGTAQAPSTAGCWLDDVWQKHDTADKTLPCLDTAATDSWFDKLMEAKAKADARLYEDFQDGEGKASSNGYSDPGDSDENTDEDDVFDIHASPPGPLPPITSITSCTGGSVRSTSSHITYVTTYFFHWTHAGATRAKCL